MGGRIYLGPEVRVDWRIVADEWRDARKKERQIMVNCAQMQSFDWRIRKAGELFGDVKMLSKDVKMLTRDVKTLSKDVKMLTKDGQE